MIFFQPVTPYFDSIKRPDCTECGSATRLVGLETERLGPRELRTFVCLSCDHIETVTMAARGPLVVRADLRLPLTGRRCRQYAEECIEMAEGADAESVADLHRMAVTFLKLAEQLLTKEWDINSRDQNAPSTDTVH